MLDVVDKLEKAGLTKQEAKVYLSLLELQQTQTGELCDHSKIASSNIYRILNSLMDKGLTSYRLQNNIKIFMPSPPEALDELFKEKQKKLEEERKEVRELISNLERKPPQKESESNYKYYEEISGVKAMWYEINNYLKQGMIERVYGTKKQAYQRILGFFDEHHEIRKEKDVEFRVIFDKEDKELAEKRKKQLGKIKYADMNNEAEWGVVGNWLYIQYVTGKTPRSFLIKDKTFAKTFKQAFEQLWENLESH